MGTDSQLEPERARVQQHIRKAVGISALRKIDGLVDEYEQEKRLARRMTPFGIALLCIAVLATLLSLYVFRFGPAERGARPAASKSMDSAPRPLQLNTGPGTEDPAVARYAEAWRAKIEKVGAKGYPRVIRDKELYGSCTLSTHIRTDDGTVERIEVAKSSGYKELDDAAQKLVLIASPFPPMPDELKQKTQILVITREFTFTKE